MRIAIIEDNKALADGIARSFKSEGHGVDQIHDGDDALPFLLGEKTDLIVLDINLPGKSGLEILRSLRNAQNQTPVLLLTARDTINDKVDGLDLGADDYLTKPFELAELLARSRALLRRGGKEISKTTEIGKLVFDPNARQITMEGETVELPRREFALAEILINRKGHVISKSQIMEHLYGVGADVEESTIELYVHRLRKKLDRSGTEIKTVRGLGYCLREVS
ncbi:MAG: response regulator transcription factor [Rhizobiaceae bacterium]